MRRDLPARAAAHATHGARRLTARWRALPDFVVLGAQKCGTTSLFAQLSQHPDVVPAAVKEVHFFDHAYGAGPYRPDPSPYRAHFPLRRRLDAAGALTGEATPYYLFHPLVTERLAAGLPDARLIVLLREPAARAVSHYWHEVRRGREREPLDRALQREREQLPVWTERVLRGQQSPEHQEKTYVSRGRYAEQLERWFARVDRERVLVLVTERYRSDPEAVLAQVTDFLDLRPFRHVDLTPRNRGRGEDVSAVAPLRAAFREDVERLRGLLGDDLPEWRA